MLLHDLCDASPLVAFGADYPATGLPFPQTSPLYGIEVGVIAPGKQADLIVPERDLFREPPHRIHAIRVDMTMLAGRIVFTRAGA